MESRIRALKMCYSVKWPDRLVMVTLTYPGDAEPEKVARSGRVARRQLKAFRCRWEREFGPIVGFWKLEFQRRGAPHWHLWLGRPVGMTIAELEKWVIGAWCAVVGSTSEAHREHGTELKIWIGNPGRYIAAYTRRSAAKEHQHRVPEGYEAPGRFWGVWGLAVEREAVAVPREVYLAERRTLRKLARSEGRKLQFRGMSGGFLITQGAAADVLVRASTVGE